MVSLCVFLAYATTASVARWVGAGDLRRGLQEGVDGLWLAAVTGVAVAAVGQPLARPAVTAHSGGADTVGPATAYLHIGLLGAPGALVVLAATGLLRGLQDTRTPLFVGLAGAATPPSAWCWCTRSAWASSARPSAPP